MHIQFDLWRGSLANMSQSGGLIDPEASFVTDKGSDGMMRALAEPNHAFGRMEVAEKLEAVRASTPDRSASAFEAADAIARRSTTFPSENGILRPSVEEVAKVIAQAMEHVDMKDAGAVLGRLRVV